MPAATSSKSALRSPALLTRLLRFAGSTDGEANHPLHNLHPYPAKYIPELPREILLSHTNERHTILDPFCGSGTTLLESELHGRRSIGIDSNPVACLIARAKTTPLFDYELGCLKRFAKVLSAAPKINYEATVPTILPNQNHWFSAEMLSELSWLKKEIERLRFRGLKQYLRCLFSSVIVSVSNQDSETRYVSVEKDHPLGFAISRFLRKLMHSVSAIEELSSREKLWRVIPQVQQISTCEATSRVIADNTADIVITSPPYPNSFDYYLYHKLRIAWLGFDPKRVQNDEIGSRYEHSSRKAPIDVFIQRSTPAWQQVRRILKPGKVLYLFVGDSVLAGETLDMEEVYSEMLAKVGVRAVGVTEYDLAKISRSFRDTRNSAGFRSNSSKMQRILVFENAKTTISCATSGRSSATPEPKNRPQSLSNAGNGSIIAIESNGDDRHVHSIIQFPSKFVPELPRWAIEKYSRKGDFVLDPFGGSGTTAVEAIILGRNGVSIDINPFASLITTAKTRVLDRKLVETEVGKLQLALLDSRRRLPASRRMAFPLDEFWFNPRHLTQFAQIKAFIETEINEGVRPLFLMILASTIRQFSYQDLSQIKVKRDPRKIAIGTQSPIELLHRRLPASIAKYLQFLNRIDSRAKVYVKTECALNYARSMEGSQRSPSLIVTSPPYINAMNYPMAMRYELLLLGLVQSEQLIDHQANYFGTERVYARDYEQFRELPSSWTCSLDLNSVLRKVFNAERKRWFIAYRYFMKMRDTLSVLANSLRPGGVFILVAGTNTVRGQFVDTFTVLSSFLTDAGLTRSLSFHYEIIKQRLKITRHVTARVIPHDGVCVFQKAT